MKKISTLLLLILGTLSMNAQNAKRNPLFKNENPAQQRFHAHVKNMLKRQIPVTAQKTTAIKQRVIGENIYDNFTTPSILQDTTKYKYSGTNGSKFDLNYMLYESYYPDNTIPQSFNTIDLANVAVKADSVMNWNIDNQGSVLLPYVSSSATFNVMSNLTSYNFIYYNMGASDGKDRYIQSYDAQGRISNVLLLNDYIGTGYDTSGKLELHYDAQNRIIRDSFFMYSMGNWDPLGVLIYSYNPSGTINNIITMENPGSGPWELIEQYDHTFYSNDNIKTVTYYSNNGAGLEPFSKDTFTYTNNNSFFTTLTEYEFDTDSNKFLFAYKIEKTINAQSLPDTVTESRYDYFLNAWLEESSLKFTYNSFNNPDKAVDVSGPGDYVFNYYYETYNDSITGIKNTTKQAEMKLYPNPAQDEVNILWKDADNKPVTIELINAAGQKISSETFVWKNQNEKISLRGATPGIYWITVRNNTGLIYKQTIVKQ